jgi:hypothetical protein
MARMKRFIVLCAWQSKDALCALRLNSKEVEYLRCEWAGAVICAGFLFLNSLLAPAQAADGCVAGR